MANRIGGRLNVARRITLAIAAMAAFVLPVGVGAMNARSTMAPPQLMNARPDVILSTPPRGRGIDMRLEARAGIKPKTILDQAADRGAAAGTQQAPPDTRPRFEVASIRPCEGIEGRRGAGFSPGRLDLTCQTLATLIREAYIVFAGGGAASPSGYDVPIVGGPDWLNSDGYLIAAKAVSEQPRAMMRGPMLQTLLEERFKLKIRRQTRELPVYALTVAGGGFKLRPIDEASCAARDLTKPPVLGAVDPVTQKPFCQTVIRGVCGVTGSMTVRELSDALGSFVDRPVINKTGIDGIFKIDVQFVPLRSPGPGGPPPDPAGGVSIFTAVQEQLGLKLESATGHAPVLVIDQVERLSPN